MRWPAVPVFSFLTLFLLSDLAYAEGAYSKMSSSTEEISAVIGLGASVVVCIFIGLLFIFIAILILKWLWNSTLPELFGFKQITWWQTFKLWLICAILFSGSGFLNHW